MDSDLETVPPEMHVALSDLRNYQENRERIEEASKQEMLLLKETFSLSLEKLNSGLANLKPTESKKESEERVETPIVEPKTQIPWLKYGFILLTISLIILYNIFFFSVAALITSILIVVWLAYL